MNIVSKKELTPAELEIIKRSIEVAIHEGVVGEGEGEDLLSYLERADYVELVTKMSMEEAFSYEVEQIKKNFMSGETDKINSIKRYRNVVQTTLKDAANIVNSWEQEKIWGKD